MAENKKITRKAQKSSGKKVSTYLICLLMICGIVFFVTQIKTEVGTTITLYAGLKDAQEELEALETEKNNLEIQMEKLTDENYVSSVARGKYLISKENEQIYVLPTLD